LLLPALLPLLLLLSTAPGAFTVPLPRRDTKPADSVEHKARGSLADWVVPSVINFGIGSAGGVFLDRHLRRARPGQLLPQQQEAPSSPNMLLYAPGLDSDCSVACRSGRGRGPCRRCTGSRGCRRASNTST
jgi:hypothetical protein